MDDDKAGAVSPEEVAGLKAGMFAEREKRHSLERDLSEMKGRLESLSQPEKRETSQVELQAAVDEGRISQDSMDRTLEDRQSQRIERKIQDTVTATITERTQAQGVELEIDRYKTAVPDVIKDGSDVRAKVESEYKFLISQGLPENSVTELAALRAALGPAERLVKGETERETHQETGSNSDAETRTDGTPKGLSSRERAFYQARVGPGKLYADWGAVEKELEFANANLRKRAR